MTKIKPTLSKSQYMKGISCLKSLWIYKNRRDLIPEVTPELQALFDMGNAIGELSMKYFDNGVAVTNEYWDIMGGEQATKDYIADGNDIIFEATAINPKDGAYSRIDILRKVDGTDEWDLIELKSSTEVKDYHYDDLSFQYYVFTGAGYKIRKCFMMLIDKTYVRYGDIEPKKLFRLEDITTQVHDQQAGMDRKVNALLEMIKQNHMPSDCEHPNNCDYCGDDIPEYSVYNLFHKTKVQKMVAEYGVHIENLPTDAPVLKKKSLDFHSYLKGETIVNPEKIAEFLKKIQYPIYFLDYETISTAIPMFDGTRPFQQIPFQFSVHVQYEPDGKLEHHEYLHKEQTDPREPLCKKLVELCGDKGSIIVYYQSFEKTRNEELAKAFPQYANAINTINDRVVDLYVPFDKRWLYHPNQHSSASIKAVLPCFTDLSYDDLEIANGGDAMNTYADFIMGNIPDNKMDAMWNALSKYCEQDTYAMVELLNVLKKHAKS